jgi:nucleotide-binding universal stress UspA family protein
MHVRVHMAESDAHQLVRLPKERDANLIVTGAYGHSRLGEWIFGGNVCVIRRRVVS